MSESNNIDELVRNLCDWFKSNGYDVEASSELKLFKSHIEEEGRCVISKKQIEPSTVLISIPCTFMLNYRYALKDSCLIEFFEWLLNKFNEPKLNRLDAIYLYLLIQLNDPSSFMHYFAKSMPSTYDTPEYFDDSLIQTLPDYLRLEIVSRLHNSKTKFEKISNLLNEFSQERPNNKSIQILVNNFTYDAFKWVFCAVNSRCFHVDEADICSHDEIQLADRYFHKLHKPSQEEELKVCSFKESLQRVEREEYFNNNQCCLIPYIDFLNHSYQSSANAQFNMEKRCYELRAKSLDEVLEEIDCEDVERFLIRENQQVYITYGHHDNKTLLIEYGFVLGENIYDRIECGEKDLVGLLKSKEDVGFLCELSAGLGLFSDLSFNKATGPSWYLLKMLDLIVELNRNQTRKTRNVKKTRRSIESIDIRSPNEIRELFLTLVKSFQAQLQKSIEKLNDLLKSSKISYIEICVKFCRLQLEIVQFNLDLINDQEEWLKLF